MVLAWFAKRGGLGSGAGVTSLLLVFFYGNKRLSSSFLVFLRLSGSFRDESHGGTVQPPFSGGLAVEPLHHFGRRFMLSWEEVSEPYQP